MTDWIHCNSCFIQPSPEKKFFLTSCGHVYCAACGEKCSNGGCYICGNRCNIIPLSSKMKPEVESYFLDPKELSKRHDQEMQKIIDFQRGHRKRLLSKTKERLEKAQALHEQFKQACNLIQELERKNKSLMQENGFLKQQLKGCGKDVSQLLGGTQQMHRTTMPTSQSNISIRSPSETLFPSPLSQYQSLMPSPTGATGSLSRITVRTPPSRGKMGIIPGSNTPGSNDHYYTPMSVSSNAGTPARTLNPTTPSPQAQRVYQSQLNNFQSSLNLPALCQIRLPGASRCSSGSIRKKATISPYSPQSTPT